MVSVMTVQLFKLKNVPDDEAQDVRDLLIKNNIDYYETPPGNWGISMPAIWLNDDGQLKGAKLLIDQYQDERLTKARGEYEQIKKDGKHRTFVNELLDSPVQFVLYIGFVAVVLYFSIKPFLNFDQ